MKKIYKSKSDIAISCLLPNKKSIHISFTSQSDGSSIYITDNKDVQYALEHHYRYGKLFRLAGEIKEKTAEEKAAEKQKQEEERAAKTINIKVSDIWEARDYLASNYGISRTKLRSEDAILNAAKEHNINFNME